MFKRLLPILLVAGAICLTPGLSDSGKLHARHYHYRSFYGGPFMGGIGYYRGYRGYGWGGPRISIGIGTYPGYYGYGGYGTYPYYSGYSTGAYYPSPVYYRSPVIIRGSNCCCQ